MYGLADEVGVTVNGHPAEVLGTDWFVNNLPLAPGENTLTVVATQPDGVSKTTTATVTRATTTADWIELSANPESGLAPLAATLRINRHLSFTPEEDALAYSGPGDVTVTPVSADEIDLSFAAPGFYSIFYTVIGSGGLEVTGEIMVHAMDRVKLDQLLQTRWNGMKSDLAAGALEGGLGYFVEGSRVRYREVFEALSGNLPALVAEMQSIELIYARNGTAKFRIRRNHDIDGTAVTMTYYIYFVKNEDGLWKIEQF